MDVGRNCTYWRRVEHKFQSERQGSTSTNALGVRKIHSLSHHLTLFAWSYIYPSQHSVMRVKKCNHQNRIIYTNIEEMSFKAPVVLGRGDVCPKWPYFHIWLARALQLDLASSHTTYYRSSIINLHEHAKCHCDRKCRRRSSHSSSV